MFLLCSQDFLDRQLKAKQVYVSLCNSSWVGGHLVVDVVSAGVHSNYHNTVSIFTTVVHSTDNHLQINVNKTKELLVSSSGPICLPFKLTPHWETDSWHRKSESRLAHAMAAVKERRGRLCTY